MYSAHEKPHGSRQEGMLLWLEVVSPSLLYALCTLHYALCALSCHPHLCLLSLPIGLKQILNFISGTTCSSCSFGQVQLNFKAGGSLRHDTNRLKEWGSNAHSNKEKSWFVTCHFLACKVSSKPCPYLRAAANINCLLLYQSIHFWWDFTEVSWRDSMVFFWHFHGHGHLISEATQRKTLQGCYNCTWIPHMTMRSATL